MARALAAAIVLSLLAVSGAGGAGAQTPKRGATVARGADASVSRGQDGHSELRPALKSQANFLWNAGNWWLAR